MSITLDHSKLGTITDENGFFNFNKVNAKEHVLVISGTGYKTISKKINGVNGDSIRLVFVMNETIKSLEEVEVNQLSASRQLLQSPQSVAVIDAKKYYNRPEGALNTITQAAGVKVRQDGGLGSSANFSINGIAGKQVKFFIDGIPADFLGAGNRINILPVNAIDRIEIYKGVVPIELGSDALGGAINVVTRQNLSEYLDASYSYGSFNTHRAVINTNKTFATNFFINAGGFLNHSDNNYKVDVDVPNEFGNPHKQTVRRFHDKYKDYYGNLEVGIRQKPWADLLSFSTSYFSMNKDVQNNVVMTEPYGMVTRNEHTWNGGLKYVKHNLIPKLNVSFYAGASNVKEQFIDTSLSAYTWDGKVYQRRIAYGEITSSKTALLFTTNNLVGRLNLNYFIDSLSSINFSITATRYHRQGKDSIAAAYFGTDFYKNPVTMFKNTMGLSYQRLLIHDKLTSISSLKYYMYDAKGFTIENMVFTPASQKQQMAGWNEAMKWQWNSRVLTKLSYEYATRLPDDVEAFGDFSLVKGNPSIKPEISNNLNIGFQYQRPKLSAALNGFYRLTKNIIFLRVSPRVSQYQNLLKAQSSGLEVDLNYRPLPILSVWLNGTYQNVINKSKKENTGNIDDRYYNLRIPNTPYVFSNGELQLTKNNFLHQGNVLQWWYGVNYVHWFYLYWSNDGLRDTKSVIPTQLVQNSGASYSFNNNKEAISFEVRNLTSAKAYDNFSVQLPGRSCQVKFRIFLHQ